MKSLYRIALTAFLAAATAATAAAAAPDVTLTQRLDSAYLLMGRTTTLDIELISRGSRSGRLVVDRNAYPEEVEIADEGATDTVGLADGGWQLRRSLTLQAFDSGLYTLPPVLYIDGADTFASKTLALKVIPVDVDSLADIHDYAAVADAGLRWYDRLPDWLVDWGLWIVLAAAAAAAALWVWRRYGRKAAATAAAPERREPPYEAAMHALEALHAEHLCEAGREREFYTRLTEILRVYLERRFGINAMEMTTTQILDALGGNETTRLPRRYMSAVLAMADFVKFAKARPLPDDNAKVYNDAVNFVEDTRPLPEPSPSGGDAPSDSQTPKN